MYVCEFGHFNFVFFAAIKGKIYWKNVSFVSILCGYFRFANDTRTTNSITGVSFQIQILPTTLTGSTTSFIPDTLPPTLLSFSIDLSRKEMEFTFSKPVNSQRCNSSALQLGQGLLVHNPQVGFLDSFFKGSSYVFSSVIIDGCMYVGNNTTGCSKQVYPL